eukprot:915815-Pleurochrysis_carterae.AAC.7
MDSFSRSKSVHKFDSGRHSGARYQSLMKFASGGRREQDVRVTESLVACWGCGGRGAEGRGGVIAIGA